MSEQIKSQIELLPIDPKEVEALLEAYLNSGPPEHADIRHWAHYHHALPLVTDMGGCTALRPSGELVTFLWDSEAVLVSEADPLNRHVARAVGARKFPSLSGLAPQRQASSRICPGCGGTGQPIPGNPMQLIGVTCICAETGWLPA